MFYDIQINASFRFKLARSDFKFVSKESKVWGRESLREDVSNVVFCGNKFDRELSKNHFILKEVIVNFNMFHFGMKYLMGKKVGGTNVVKR